MIEVAYLNYIFYRGENAKDNFDLLDKFNDYPDYLWFHLNSFPSPYVIVNITKFELLNNNDKDLLLKYACDLCKDNSKYKNLKNLKIIWTPIKNLKKTENIGEVIISGKKNIISI